MPPSPDSSLDLLLADANNLRPILERGLPTAPAANGPKPPRGADDRGMLRRASLRDPNDLRGQRWGIVAPEGPGGDEKLEAIMPLIGLRESEQGAPVTIYRAPAGLDRKAVLDWKYNVLENEANPDGPPQYLLILGDLDQVSLELQQSLANESFVGRIHFPHVDGYDRYARKIVQWAQNPAPEDQAEAFFFIAGDTSSATSMSRTLVIDACQELAQKAIERQRFPVANTQLLEGSFDKVRRVMRPAVLLSVAHGLGCPSPGWKSIAEQRALQGALLVGQNELLTAEHVQDTPFLPGGFWVNLASFSAGTSKRSEFARWLQQLSQQAEYRDIAEQILKSAPGDNAPPFLAALPQAALANPNGPLAIIGQIDLAWTYRTNSLAEPIDKAKPLFNSMLIMAGGGRAGPAHYEIASRYREAQFHLMGVIETEEMARMNALNVPPIDPVQRAQLWMQRHDLRTFTLLGDPAVRLPLQSTESRKASKAKHATPNVAPAAVSPASTPTTSTASSTLSVEQIEEIVLSIIRGDKPLQDHATRHQIPENEITKWIETYKTAGRAAIAQFRQPNPKKD